MLAIRGVSKSFRATGIVLRDVSLDVACGEFVALVGPSGGGKSTLVRCICGLDEPDTGSISIDGKDLDGRAPHSRGVGVVLQDRPLYDHLRVSENLGFPLRVQGASREVVASRVSDVSSLLALDGMGARRASDLSGGERGRVALGRALVLQPSLLLLDEPLAHLDGPLRRQLRETIRSVHEATAATTLLVTHDQHEAWQLADRIAVLIDGSIRQIAAPAELLEAPADEDVADFLGVVPSP